METGKLTPRSNNLIAGMRFTGAFGQPDGFGSVLSVEIKESGNISLTLTYTDAIDKENQWSVELDNEQRKKLGDFLGTYHPKLSESYK